jgi:trehalose 6-phosphate phosphatase
MPTILPSADKALTQLSKHARLWLFLDYDGTLADFAPTPDIVSPDAALIALLSALHEKPDLRLAVISGRRLKHVRSLVPIPGIWLAGTYGIELLTPGGEQLERLDYRSIRPALEGLKLEWHSLIGDHSGFYLEDKGWSLAIHARYATDQEAAETLSAARDQAQTALKDGNLRLQGGHKFLEICPQQADKGETLEHILSSDVFPGALPVYIGDDDKDERAFSAVNARQGIAIVVMAEVRPTQAGYTLANPAAVRAWLKALLHQRNSKFI